MSGDDKKRSIMQAVEKLIASKPLHEITTDDIAEHARVGKGTIYRHFAGKDDLFFQTATQGFIDLCELLGRYDQPAKTTPQQVREVCQTLCESLGRRHRLFRALQAEDARTHWRGGGYFQRWRQHHEHLVDCVERIVARGVERGDLRRDIPARALAVMLLGLVRVGTREFRACGADPEAPVDWMADLFLWGAAGNGAATGCAPSAGDGESAPPPPDQTVVGESQA